MCAHILCASFFHIYTWTNKYVYSLSITSSPKQKVVAYIQIYEKKIVHIHFVVVIWDISEKKLAVDWTTENI